MDIFHLFNIKTTDIKKVFDAITTQNGLSSWWTTETIAEQKLNSILEFRFTKDYKKCMKIINLKKNELIVQKTEELKTALLNAKFPLQVHTSKKLYASYSRKCKA